jgi:hypothetical protein
MRQTNQAQGCFILSLAVVGRAAKPARVAVAAVVAPAASLLDFAGQFTRGADDQFIRRQLVGCPFGTGDGKRLAAVYA